MPSLESPAVMEPEEQVARIRLATAKTYRGEIEYWQSNPDDLVGAFLPLVKGIATIILPESPESVEAVCTTVFQAFHIRGHKLPKKTLLAFWFLKSALFAGNAERKRLRLPRCLPQPSAATLRILRRLFKCRRDAVRLILFTEILKEPIEPSASRLKLKLRKAEKVRARTLKQLTRALRKREKHFEVSSLLNACVASETEASRAAILNSALHLPARSPKPAPLRKLLTQWRWFRVRLFLHRFLKVVGSVAGIAGLAFGIFVFLATHGYLTGFFLKMQGRQVLKDVPELAIPANPWPSSEEDKAMAASGSPKSSDELFTWNRIWPVRISFTPEQWNQLKPSDIPGVNLMGPGGRLVLRNPKAKRSGLAGVVGIEFNWAEAKLDFAEVHLDKVAVRYRGNGTYLNSLYGPKHSFKIDLNKFTKKQKLAGVKELNLLNSVPDNSYIYDALSERFFRDLGVLSPRTSYTYVSVDAPGTFTNQAFGLYVLVENIDSDYAENRFGSKAAPIFKPVTYDLFKYIGDNWKDYAPIYDLKTKATEAQQKRLIEFSKIVTQANDEEFARKLPDFLDLEEFAGFVAGHVLMSSYDGFLANGQNFYMYLDPQSNRFGFIPWDQDHSWGEFRYTGSEEQREKASIWEPQLYDFHFLQRVMQVPAFKEIYRAKIDFALKNVFVKDRLYSQIDELAGSIRSAVSAESQFRLRRFEEAVSDKWIPGPRDAGPPEGPLSRVHQIKRFIPNRIQSVRDQLDGKSKGERLQRH